MIGVKYLALWKTHGTIVLIIRMFQKSPFVSLDFQAMFEQYITLLVKVYLCIFQSMFDGLTLTAKELSSPTTRVIQIDTRGDLA